MTDQQKKIINSFTSENYIEWSKAISNEDRQRKVIFNLEGKIDSLKNLYTLSYNNFKEYRYHNDSLVKKLNETNVKLFDNFSEKEDLLKKQLFSEKLKKWYVAIAAVLTIILIK